MELLETINHAPKGDMSMIPQKQLTLADIFEDCQEIYESDKPQFLTLLENHIDLDEIVPVSFRNHYYASTGRNRKYPLNAMLWALIIQRLFSIPTDSLLLVFLHYSRHLREFCGFTKVPDASKITRFKQDFLPAYNQFLTISLISQNRYATTLMKILPLCLHLQLLIMK